MNRLILSAVLLAVAVSAWEIKLWPLSGSGSGSASSYSSAPPMFSGDYMIIPPPVNGEGTLYVANTTSQTLLWGKSFGGVTGVALVTGCNTIIVGSSDLTFAFDVATGKQKWISDTTVPATGSALIVSGSTVVFTNAGGSGSNSAVPSGVVGIDATTGALVYSAFSGAQGTLMSIDATHAAITDANGNLIVFDPATGKRMYSLAGNPNAYPAMSFLTSANGLMAVTNTTSSPYDSVVLIVDVATGNVTNTFHGMTNVAEYLSGSKIQNGFYYGTIDNGLLQAYDLQSNHMYWQLNSYNPNTGASGTVYITPSHAITAQSDSNGNQVFYIYSLKTGNVMQTLTGYPSSPNGGFTVAGNYLVVPNLQGIVVVNLITGKIVYRNEDLPTIGANGGAGIVYEDGYLTWATPTAAYGIRLP